MIADDVSALRRLVNLRKEPLIVHLESIHPEKKQSQRQMSNATWHIIANKCKSGLHPFKCYKEHLAY